MPFTRPTVTVTVAASESVKRSVAVCLRLIFDFASLTFESFGVVLSVEPPPAPVAAVTVTFFVAAFRAVADAVGDGQRDLRAALGEARELVLAASPPSAPSP